MLAVGLCLGLFLFWGAVGYAVASALSGGASRNPLQNLLLGPALGIVLTVTPLFLFSRAGVSVHTVAFGVLSVLTLVTLVLFLWVRPNVDWRRAMPFVGTLALALVLTGRPMFEFGLNWMSYCNDDMANYCLSGRWLKDHGVADAPTPQEITGGQDYSKIYWMLHVPAMSRVGCELLISWSSALTGISEHQVFNPLILVFHLALIAGAGAMVLRSSEFYSAAVMTCLLLSLSAMNSLGTLMQVLAQVGGLSILTACAAIVFQPYTGLTRGQLVRHALLVGIVGAGQAILYAEVLPFLFLAFCLYLSIEIIRGHRPWRQVGVVVGGAVVAVVVLNRHIITVITYIVVQSAGGSLGDDPVKSLMPYFLVPGGLANLWGFQHITVLSGEPLLSLTILIGAVLLLAGTAGAIWMSWRGVPVACFAVVMVVVGFYLFRQRTGFGMFKLAMFVQPFLLGSITVAWFALTADVKRRPRLARYGPLVLLGLSGVAVQQWYLFESRGTRGDFSLIPFASPSQLDSEIEKLAQAHGGPNARIVCDPYNVVVAKFQSLHGQGSTLIFPSADFFRTPMTYQEHVSTAGPKNLARAREITKGVDSVFPDADFDLHDPEHPGAINRFHINKVGGYDGSESSHPETLFIESSGIQGIYNRRPFPPPASFRAARGWTNFHVVPYSQVRNHLIAVASHLSQPFYSADPARIGVYQLEPEPYWFRGATMAGLGRYLMFQVINPTKEFRLVMNVTASYLADGDNLLPEAAVIGDGRWTLGATGRGSARLFSPPMVPQRIDGRDFLMVDMGRIGKRFPSPHGGLMTLYGTDVALDRRQLVAFGRDVSVISEEQYRNLAPPSKLEHFPQDLAHADLEYSGIYEDGWCSASAYAWLSDGRSGADSLAAPKAIVVRGFIPEINNDKTFRTEMHVSVDGKEIASQVVGPGPFELRGLIPASGLATPGARHRVEFRGTQSEVQRLPQNDRRPVVAKLELLGIVDATPADRGLAQR